MFQNKRAKLGDLREREKWENLEHRYFRNLDFLDIMFSIESYTKKRTIAPDEVKKQSYYYKAYIDQNQRLLRIDYERGRTDETYIIYEGSLAIKACKFITGEDIDGKRIDDDFLTDEWIYQYDEDMKLEEMTWHEYPDLENRYSYHNELFNYYYFEYDEKGLLLTFQRTVGLDLYGEEFTVPERVIYDRKRDEMLKKHTISKKSWIPKNKKTKKTIDFKFGGHSPIDLVTPVCPTCMEKLTFICTVDLGKPFKKKTHHSTVPVYYCFECSEYETTINIGQENILSTKVDDECDTLPETPLQLGISHVSETEETALIKIGGLPNWIQDEQYPNCEECGETMIFVCQINSDESFFSENHYLMFGDSGRLYTFICCDTVTSIMQCY